MWIFGLVRINVRFPTVLEIFYLSKGVIVGIQHLTSVLTSQNMHLCMYM